MATSDHRGLQVYMVYHPHNEAKGETKNLGQHVAKMAVRCEWRPAAYLG